MNLNKLISLYSALPLAELRSITSKRMLANYGQGQDLARINDEC